MENLLFNRFEIQEQIGSGGSADVFLANDIRMERHVAIKRIPKKEQTAPRAIRESRTVALLSHPNIVTVHDFLEDDKYFYIVMERISGVVLSNIIDKTKFDWQQAVAATLQISHALECAHSNDIIHRDIKPANLIMLPDGRIKVLDFGISRLKKRDSLTTHDQIIGTLAYISPEQARAEPVDERSDIFSLGIVAYELLTGVNPFDSETHAATIFKIIHSNPDHPSKIDANIPVEIGDIIMKMLNKDADERYSSIVEMRYKFERYCKNINEQKVLKQVISKFIEPEKVRNTPSKEKTKFDLLGSLKNSTTENFLIALISFFIAFAASSSAQISPNISLFFSLSLSAFTFFIPRLGFLVLILFFAILAGTYYWWLAIIVFPLLFAYFYLSKFQNNISSLLPFTSPILAHFNMGMLYPALCGIVAVKPIEAISSSIIGGLFIVIYDSFMNDSIKYFFVTSPKLGTQTFTFQQFIAEFGSIFFVNPAIILQIGIFAGAGLLIFLIKKGQSKKWVFYALMVYLLILPIFIALSYLMSETKFFIDILKNWSLALILLVPILLINNIVLIKNEHSDERADTIQKENVQQ